jgi:alginate O-acetyltransferase complex protein AlgI
MVFSSPIFIFAFLPAVIGFYYFQKLCLRNRFRNLILLVFSYFFYLYGAGHFVLILALSTLGDYVFALRIDRKGARRKTWVLLSIVLNLGLLFYFKYTNFFLWELNKVLSAFGADGVHWTSIALPIGISFFTFQKLSYVIDVYRGERKALRSFVDLALYIAMFPQLIAGPIVRFSEISEQLQGRKESWGGVRDGVMRFSWGFAKKILIANACGEVADAVFDLPAGDLDTRLAWLGTLAYTLQIYFDFSAYSDMAIGLGMFFGFRLPENFHRPYSAVSITDFWRRWHMTLSRWFRDYLYIPLGGSRRGSTRTYANLVVVFVLCGLWHGASGIFVAWGLYHGCFLVAERLCGLRAVTTGYGAWWRRLATLLIVMLGWVLFRADNLGHAGSLFHAMFIPDLQPLPNHLRLALNSRNLVFMLLGSSVLFFPREFTVGQFMLKSKGFMPAIVRVVAVGVLLPYALFLTASGSYNPFIYFRF